MMVVGRQRSREDGACRMLGFSCMLSVFALSVLGGCANDENVRKSKGFYQEGSRG